MPYPLLERYLRDSNEIMPDDASKKIPLAAPAHDIILLMLIEILAGYRRPADEERSIRQERLSTTAG